MSLLPISHIYLLISMKKRKVPYSSLSYIMLNHLKTVLKLIKGNSMWLITDCTIQTDMRTCKPHIPWNKINHPACPIYPFCLFRASAHNATIWTHEDTCRHSDTQFKSDFHTPFVGRWSQSQTQSYNAELQIWEGNILYIALSHTFLLLFFDFFLYD